MKILSPVNWISSDVLVLHLKFKKHRSTVKAFEKKFMQGKALLEIDSEQGPFFLKDYAFIAGRRLERAHARRFVATLAPHMNTKGHHSVGNEY